MTKTTINTLAVFCGANTGHSNEFSKAAEQLAEAMASKNIALVYGGAKVGLMGAIANRMLKNDSKVIGVMPKALVEVEIAHEGLTELHVVNSMHERKALICELAEGFIMMPGGYGSFDEFFEMLTWGQLGYHAKPCGILNVAGYYDHLLKFLVHAAAEGFIKEAHRQMIIVEESAEKLLERLMNYKAPAEKKWIR